MDEHAFFALVDGIYDAATDRSAWRPTLEKLYAGLHSNMAALAWENQASGAADGVVAGLPATVRAAYCQGQKDHNVLMQRALAQGPGAVITERDLMSPDELAATGFYREWQDPFGLHHLLGFVLHRDRAWAGTLTIGRPHQAGAFSADDIAFGQLLMPHLQRASALSMRLARLEFQRQTVVTALDRLGHGVFLLDAAGRIAFANQPGEALLRTDDGMKTVEGRPRAARAIDTAQLDRLIARAVRGTPTEGGAAALARPSGKRPLQAIVVPFRHQLEWLPRPTPAALLLLVDPEESAPTQGEILRQLYGLSPAEARLTLLIIAGSSRQQAAEQLGIADATARTQLERVFAKTGTRRQAELIRLLAGLSRLHTE